MSFIVYFGQVNGCWLYQQFELSYLSYNASPALERLTLKRLVFTKNVKHTETNLHLPTASLFKNVWLFSGHKVVRVKGYPAGNYMLKFNNRNGLWPSGQNSQNAVIGLVRLSPWEWFKVDRGEAKYQLKKHLNKVGNKFKVNNKDNGVILVSLLFSLNIFQTLFWCFYC